MISVCSTATRAALLVFAGGLLCAAAQASTQAPRADASTGTPPARLDVDADWATPPAPAALPKRVDLDSLPPAPPVSPREEKILPRSEWLNVEPMKAPDRRCDPGLDALFLSKECGKDPSWLGSHKK
ncbi:hypothetical protein [Janthinobacterium sp. 1_2014MBL_MicDiv]|uniref:hypothetical protein n=1 Tax=Janthinobacterium sp. 1_2014MBL_MicDiv TaxID=1644131 RepID=UPI0008F4E714|nr:hypothetical protein [Janthinobacterium sp. 1_2014MBL_MicDiv]APA69044.1 hypothetical protein YQ44_16000 [Janthinobacterium sp. 1_2014MBL_MicDiv]